MPASPIGMVSIKRISIPRPIAKSIMDSISSSLTPFMTTILSLIGLIPADIAASIPLITVAKSPSLVISLKRSGIRESIEILALLTPFAFNLAASGGRRCALVESGISLSPGISPSILVSSSISFRSRGSPPVRRTFVTPSSENKRTIFAVSSKERT